MDLNLKKMWPAAATSLVAITSLLSAADDMQMRNMENRLTALEQRKGANGMINPSARPGVRDGSDVFVTAAALYWKPNESGLEYAIDGTDGGNTTYAKEGSVLNSRSKYSWGFKVGLGYNMPHDGWDLYLNWTHFTSKKGWDCCEEGCEEECGECGPCVPTPVNPCPSIIFPVAADFATPFIPPGYYACDAFSKWKLRLNILDLEMGRDFFVSKYLSLRPNFGLRGVKINQTQAIQYNGILTTEGPQLMKPLTIGTMNIENHIKNGAKFWGVGPRAGVNTLWSFGSGWGLYGDAAISLLYGRMNTLHNEYLEFGVPTSPCECEEECECECVLQTPVQDLEGNGGRCKKQYLTRAATDLALGIAWDHQFRDDRFHLGFALGWEHHMFFGMNQFMRFHDVFEQGSMSANNGDLATQGWTLSGRFDF